MVIDSGLRPFTLSGPDGDGFVWLHMTQEDGTETSLNLGTQDEVAEILSQKLGEWDWEEN